MSTVTTDAFFNGRIRIKQTREGYRFSIDAVILAASLAPNESDVILDIGTGSGIIPLITAYRYPRNRIVGVEVQGDLADIARLNVRENPFADRIRIENKDIKSFHQKDLGGPADIVVSNPPFYKMDSGRRNPHEERAIARHEIKITLEELVESVGGLLKIGGRFHTIYGAERLVDLVAALRGNGLEPKNLQCIHSTIGTEAKLILLEAVKGGRPGMMIKPSLFIYDDNGNYTDEMEEMFQP